MFDPVSFGLVLAISVAGGFAGSLLGLGGGVVVVPLLTVGMGYPVRSVVGASLVSVIATSSGAAAAYVRDRLTNLRVAVLMEVATSGGAIVGAYFSPRLPARVVYGLLALLLAYSAAAMFHKRRREQAIVSNPSLLARRLRLQGAYRDEALGRVVVYQAGRVVPAFLVMALAGGASGVLGIGAGVFKVLGLDMVMGLPIKVSTATSNFMIGVTAAAGAGVHFARGDVDPALAAPVALGVLAGAWLGSRVLPRMRAESLRLLFIPLLLFMAWQMARAAMG